jgi:periplasmic divalent cation tolerance protein
VTIGGAESSPVLILSTAPSHEEASRIAEALIENRLAACVQLSPIESWYRWQGKIEHASETGLQIKTMAHLVAEVEHRIRALHAYEVPEILVIPVIGGGAEYLGWIAESIRSESG